MNMTRRNGPRWGEMLDLSHAVDNLKSEAIGDWHRDPWGWPEYGFLLREMDLLHKNLDTDGVAPVTLVDVPKENFASRPAMILDPVDRVSFTALVDYFSPTLIGKLDRHVFGWRLNRDEPKRGPYERNRDEWDRFRSHLLETSQHLGSLLITDIVSCFANISVSRLRDALGNALPGGVPLERLSDMLAGWEETSTRPGIPQRSSASAVLANFYLQGLDLVLQDQALRVGKAAKGQSSRYSWARWMDDIWLFGKDAGALRRAQVELQAEAATLGLNLNASKTELLEGPDALQRALNMEHSAVDDELLIGTLIVNAPRSQASEGRSDTPLLDEMIDGILLNQDKVSRTTLRFATTRMRSAKKLKRAPDLLSSAHRMPHGADHLARLFRESIGIADYQDWFLAYVKSPWASYEWAIANFGTALTSGGRRPRKATRDYFAAVLADGRTSLPLFALAAQRMSTWDPDGCRLALREAVRSTSSPHLLRVAAFAGIASGEPRTTVRQWLSGPENRLSRDFLEDRAFRALRPTRDYAGD